jgi:predicted small metal-binding protein
MARIVNCPCGHVLTGKDDEELFALAKQHVREHHPDSNRSEDGIRQLVTQMAQNA